MTCDEHIENDDPKKLGYIAWHTKAQEWMNARKRDPVRFGPQVQCACRKWFFPWERRGYVDV